MPPPVRAGVGAQSQIETPSVSSGAPTVPRLRAVGV